MAQKRIGQLPPTLLALIAAGLFLLLSFSPSFKILERHLLDLSFQLRGEVKPAQEIVIVEITDNSLDLMGAWPWPRSFHAALLNVLRKSHVRAVFVDMIFSEPSTEKDDALLTQEIKRAKNVVLPYYFPNLTEKRTSALAPTGFPIPSIRESVGRLGFVNSTPDQDGSVREAPLFFQSEQNLYFHSALALYGIYKNLNDTALKSVAPQNRLLINFPGRYESFTRYSFESLLDLENPHYRSLLDSLQDKIILIGHTATGTAMDLKPTAFGAQYPGVGLQASLLHTLLTEKWILPLPWYVYGVLLWLLAWFVLELSFVSNPIRGGLYLAGSLTLLFLIIQIAFQYSGLWIPFFGFFSLAVTVYLLITLYHFFKARLEREILTRELTLAARIQNNFLPNEIPSLTGLDIAAKSLPAKHVGGDLYDMLSMDQERWGFCVGDVSGKGVPAALFMAKAISEFRREATTGTPGAILSQLNRKLIAGDMSGLFLTLVFLIFKPSENSFVFSSAGHEPILFYQEAQQKVDLIKAQGGLPLGIDADVVFDNQEVTWLPGDFLVLTSDGVKEAMNEQREIFGFERMQKALLESSHQSAQEIVEHLLKRILDFTGTAPQHDDTTIVCLKKLKS